MTAEELIQYLSEKYGEDFNWFMLPFSDSFFRDELNKELGEQRFSKEIYAVAKCGSKDDVLFMIDDNDYRIYHLTYTAENMQGYPKCISFDSVQAAFGYIEKDYIENYL